MNSSENSNNLFRDMNNRIQLVVQAHIETLNNVSENKINEIVNNREEFERIKNKIYSNMISKTDNLVEHIKTKADKAKFERNKKINELERKIDNLSYLSQNNLKKYFVYTKCLLIKFL